MEKKMNNFIKNLLVVVGIIIVILIFSVANAAE
jgi:hypothetical protein